MNEANIQSWGAHNAINDIVGVPFDEQNVRTTPLARRMASGLNIDIANVSGSGYAGKIFAADLEAVQNAPDQRIAVNEMAFEPASVSVFEPESVIEVVAEPATEPVVEPVSQTAPNYANDYASNYKPDYANDYARNVVDVSETDDHTGNYVHDYANDYARTVVDVSETDDHTGNYVHDYANDYTANRAHDYANDYARTMTNVPETNEKPGHEVSPVNAKPDIKYPDEEIVSVLPVNENRRAIQAHRTMPAAYSPVSVQYFEVDITELMALKRQISINSTSIPLTVFYLKAITLCVREFERFRMRLSEAGDSWLLFGGASVGIATGIGEDAQIPIVRNADTKTPYDLTMEVGSLVEKVKHGSLEHNEKTMGHITLLNLEQTGIHTFSPMVSCGETAVIGIGAPYKRLVMGENSIDNRLFIMMSLAHDNRVINESEAAGFQNRLKILLEHPNVFGM